MKELAVGTCNILTRGINLGLGIDGNGFNLRLIPLGWLNKMNVFCEVMHMRKGTNWAGVSFGMAQQRRVQGVEALCASAMLVDSCKSSRG